MTQPPTQEEMMTELKSRADSLVSFALVASGIPYDGLHEIQKDSVELGINAGMAAALQMLNEWDMIQMPGDS